MVDASKVNNDHIQGSYQRSFARRLKLLRSSFQRSLRWEFWPVGLFYIPVVIYILGLVVRYRGLSFTAVNPAMPGSGFIGENKSLSLLQLQQHGAKTTAKTGVIIHTLNVDEKVASCEQFMAGNSLGYPIVLKPDFGQRGLDVEIINNPESLKTYLTAAVFDTVIQEYIPGVEFGVFYVREPNANKGRIFSITHKCFPRLEGDGSSTIEALIFTHPRLQYMASFLLKQHRAQLHDIPSKGEKINVVSLGSHCQGSLFLEGEQYHTDILADVIDNVSQHLNGFYFGRYDIRAQSIEAFQQGDIRVIEVNGVTSESTNMYDPSNTVFTAYKILFEQWRLAFSIGQMNIQQGHPAMTLGDLIGKVRMMNTGT